MGVQQTLCELSLSLCEISKHVGKTTKISCISLMEYFSTTHNGRRSI